MRTNRYTIFLVILIAFNSLHTSAKTIKIKFSITDCLNCYSALNTLALEYKQEPIVFLMEEKYQRDTLKIIKRFFLDEFTNMRFEFSDSAYKAMSYYGSVSEIFIIDDFSGIVYRSVLTNFEKGLFATVYFAKNLEKGKLAYPIPPQVGLANLEYLKNKEAKLIMQDELGGVAIWDLVLKKTYKPMLEIEAIYNSLTQQEGSGFTKDKVKALLYMYHQEKLFQLEPKVQSVHFMNDSSYVLLIGVHDFDVKGTDTSIFGKQFIFTYNSTQNKLRPMGAMPRSADHPYNMSVFYDKGLYYFEVLNRRAKLDTTNIEELNVLHQYTFKDKKFIPVQYEKAHLSSNLVKGKVGYELLNSSFGKGIYAKNHGSSFYDLAQKRNIEIGLPDSLLTITMQSAFASNSLNTYFFDYHSSKNSYCLLMNRGKKNTYLIVDKQGKLLEQYPVIYSDWATMPIFFYNSNYVVYKLLKEDAIVIQYVGK